MTNDNETMEDIIQDIRENDGYCISPTSLFDFDEDGGILLGDLAERIETTYKREIAAKDKEIAQLKKSVERWMEYHQTMKCERDAFLDELKKKYAEIDRFREYLREAVEWSCGNPDDNCGDCAAHGGDTPCVCEKWRNALKGGAK